MWDAFSAPEMLVIYAGCVFTVAYLIINQVMLRLTLLVGTGFYIWYYFVINETPLWEAIWTSFAMATANLIGLANLYWHRSRHAVPKRDQDIFDLFPGVPPGDFRELMRHAERVVLTEPREITTEGAPVSHLYYVISGNSVVRKLGEVFPLPPQVFVGEVAYLTGRPAAATTQLREGAEVLRWSMEALHRRAARKPRFKLAVQAMISVDLANKVSAAVAPRMRVAPTRAQA